MASYADSKYAARWEAAFGKKIRRLYGQAQKEVQQKMEDFTKKHQEKDALMRAKLNRGEITEAEYMQWLQGQVFIGGRWRQKVVEISKVYVNADKKARELVRDVEYSEFTSSSNYQAWDIEKNTHGAVSFDLYDDRAVTRLIRDNPQMLPKWKIDEKKDYVWNEKRVRNSVIQAIIQGESMDKLAKRLSSDLSTSNGQHMMMFARTAVTGAQNEGSLQRMRDAEDLGLKVQKRWLATLDSRTRDSHAELDGQTVDVDEPFVTRDGTKIMCPGDPSAPPEEVCNCRCTMITVYPQYEHLFSEGERRAKEETTDAEGKTKTTEKVIPYQTYSQWAAAKQAQAEPKKKEAKKAEQKEKKVVYTEAEKDALHDYTTSLYSGINTLLRDDELDEWPDAKKIVDQIDKAMDKSVVEDGEKFSRGATVRDLEGLFGHKRSWYEEVDNLKSLEGQTAKFKSYVSTTKGDDVSEAYTDRGLEWHFITDGEVHGVDMEPFTNREQQEIEKETLFDRGVEVEIEEVRVKSDEDGYVDGKIEIWARLKGPEANKSDEPEAEQQGKEEPNVSKSKQEVEADFISLKAEDVKEVFGERPDRSLRKQDPDEYQRQREEYESSSEYEWKQQLTSDELTCVTDYTSDSYAGINGLLRGFMTEKQVRNWDISAQMPIEEEIKHVESALSKFELREDVTLYRTCEKDFFDALGSPGDLFKDEGFCSCSIFSTAVASGQVDVEIKVPKGVGRGAWVKSLSHKPEENEFLLQRGSIFEIESMRQKDNGRWEVKLRWIGAEPDEYRYASKQEVIEHWKKLGIFEYGDTSKI